MNDYVDQNEVSLRVSYLASRVQGFILHRSHKEKKSLTTYFREQCGCACGEEIEKAVLTENE
jgi:hypothetical protein